jgi:EAL domain-containing protein (putative c-di-GMP-specific phosphodiesterase class I)
MSETQSQEGHASSAAGELEGIAHRLLESFGCLRVVGLSFHDKDADVLWLTESVLGPDEHEVVRASMDIFASAGAPARQACDIGDGRVAITLRAQPIGGPLLGLIMIIVDQRVASDRRLALSANGMRQAIAEFTAWLEPELPPPVQHLRAPPTLVATAPQADAILERQFTSLRSQPIALYAQHLEPMGESGQVQRYEILLRSGTDQGRMQAPVAMLEAATKQGLGSVMDRRVVTDLVIWLARSADAWQASPIDVTVNLSANSLVDPHFLKFLEQCLGKSGLPRGMIGFELDASVCARQLDRARDFTKALAGLGCKVVLDNFSMLDGHLDLLALDGLHMLKLHPRLTQTLSADRHRQAAIGGAAQMAWMLGMHTCAKAIESSRDRPLLASLNVDFAQGFAFSMPRPVHELG